MPTTATSPKRWCQIAREWVKVDPAVLAELKKLAAKMPMPATGLTDKNKRFLRQFDDPAVLQRLHDLPGTCGRKCGSKPPALPNLGQGASGACAQHLVLHAAAAAEPGRFDV